MDEKYKIVSRLMNEEEPKVIAADMDVSYNKVLRLKRELKLATDAGKLQEFIDIDSAMMHELTEIAKEHVPDVIKSDAGEALTKLAATKNTLEALSTEFQLSAKFLSNRIKTAASTADQPHELQTLAAALCDLQNAFFNKNQTQVNVQNNYGEADNRYGSLLGDKPTDQ